MTEPRVALFVDVQNIYYTTRQVFNSHFDYNAFWAQVGQGRQIVKAIAYAIDRGDARQQQVYGVEPLTAASLMQVSSYFVPITRELLLPIQK